jgi:hypothetical protein
MKSKTLFTQIFFDRRCKLVVISVVLLTLLPQCAVKRPAMTTGIIDKVALMSTTVNFVKQAGVSGPAAVARGQFNNKAEEINNLMTYFVDSLHQAVARNLRIQLGSEVVYGEELHALPDYSALKERYERVEALHKDDEHFPEVVISQEDFNFFIAETKGGVMNGGKTISIAPEELQTIIPDICEKLGIQYIGIAEFVLTGFKQAIIFAPDLYFRYYFYLYNNSGELIATSYNNETTVKIIETDMTGSYENMIRSYLSKSELIEFHAVVKKKR